MYTYCCGRGGILSSAVKGGVQTLDRPAECGSVGSEVSREGGFVWAAAIEGLISGPCQCEEMVLGEAFSGRGFLRTGEDTGMDDALSLKAVKEGGLTI